MDLADAYKFGITNAEGDSLISIHFVGKATSNTSAEGTITIFVDGLNPDYSRVRFL